MAKGSETLAGAEAAAENLVLESEATRRSQRRGAVWGLRLAVLAIFLTAWQIISGPIISTFFISRPSDVMNELWNLISSGILLRNLPVTLEEATVGYFAGGLLAILLGVLFG